MTLRGPRPCLHPLKEDSVEYSSFRPGALGSCIYYSLRRRPVQFRCCSECSLSQPLASSGYHSRHTLATCQALDSKRSRFCRSMPHAELVPLRATARQGTKARRGRFFLHSHPSLFLCRSLLLLLSSSPFPHFLYPLSSHTSGNQRISLVD